MYCSTKIHILIVNQAYISFFPNIYIACIYIAKKKKKNKCNCILYNMKDQAQDYLRQDLL